MKCYIVLEDKEDGSILKIFDSASKALSFAKDYKVEGISNIIYSISEALERGGYKNILARFDRCLIMVVEIE